MGWRKAAAMCAELECGVVDDEYRVEPDMFAERLLEMVPELRIALARELLAGTDRVVTRDVAEHDADVHGNPYSGYRDGEGSIEYAYSNGWNAARSAMLGDTK